MLPGEKRKRIVSNIRLAATVFSKFLEGVVEEGEEIPCFNGSVTGNDLLQVERLIHEVNNLVWEDDTLVKFWNHYYSVCRKTDNQGKD